MLRTDSGALHEKGCVLVERLVQVGPGNISLGTVIEYNGDTYALEGVTLAAEVVRGLIDFRDGAASCEDLAVGGADDGVDKAFAE